MKVLLLLFLVGCASASFYDALDHASDELVIDFLAGMEKSQPISDAVGYFEEAEQIGNDIKNGLGKLLKDTLASVTEEVRQAVAQGKKVGEELVNRAKAIAAKLKELGLQTTDKAKDLAERLKEKAKEFLKGVLEKLGLQRRGLTPDWVTSLLQNYDVASLLTKLKEKLSQTVSVEGITQYIKDLFGNTFIAKLLLEVVDRKGIEAIKDLINSIIPSKVNEPDYSLVEMWEKIRHFFKDAGVQIRDKFTRFSEWLREAVRTGIENAKDTAEKLKIIAQEVINKSKTMTKEAAMEALEFFRPYKEDLGTVWDEIKETVNRVIHGY